MAAVIENVIQEYRNWVQVFVLIDYNGGKLCLDVLFKKGNWPIDGVNLHKRLEPEHSRICCLENQCQVLCPSSGIADHDFNLTFFTRIIDVIFGGKYESLVKDMRKIRGTRNVEAINKFLILTLIIFGNAQQTC